MCESLTAAAAPRLSSKVRDACAPADLVRVEGHRNWDASRRAEAADFMRSGMHLEGVPLLPAGVRWLNEAQLQVILVEGRHRQIRRMCEKVGLRVAALKRVRIGPIRLGTLGVGQWLVVSRALHQQLADSSTGLAKRVEEKRTAVDLPKGRIVGRFDFEPNC